MSTPQTFTTHRLFVRPLKEEDAVEFYDMMGNPNVMSPIPQKAMSKIESDAKLLEFISAPYKKTIWAICEKDKDELIGLAALLINDLEQNEIGYRLREQFWGIGYGTEIAKGLIDYCFNDLHFKFVTADVNVSNMRSIKILSKFMVPVQSFYNVKAACNDRRYKVMNKNA